MTAFVLLTDGVTAGLMLETIWGKKYSVLSREETLEAPSSAVPKTFLLLHLR